MSEENVEISESKHDLAYVPYLNCISAEEDDASKYHVFLNGVMVPDDEWVSACASQDGEEGYVERYIVDGVSDIGFAARDGRPLGVAKNMRRFRSTEGALELAVESVRGEVVIVHALHLQFTEYVEGLVIV